jgi:hypothetical protein
MYPSSLIVDRCPAAAAWPVQPKLIHPRTPLPPLARRRAPIAAAGAPQVLEIQIKRSVTTGCKATTMTGKLSLVDLAGSERAAETNNHGQKLRDGANINKSLLALANCINALGKQQKNGMAYVPYRNSKLTRYGHIVTCVGRCPGCSSLRLVPAYALQAAWRCTATHIVRAVCIVQDHPPVGWSGL